MKLAGKTALVTGSSQGIGEAIAIRLAEEGANVVVNYHSHAESAAHVVDAIKKLGRECVSLGADLGRLEDVRRLVHDGAQQLGQLDILVNNAGVEKNADFWNVTEADYDQVLDVNLKGVFFTTQVFVQHLMGTKRPGKIINVSSVHEELPFPAFHSVLHEQGGRQNDDAQPGD